MVVDAGRAVVLAYNKWDLVDDERRRYLEREIEQDLVQVQWAPRVNISARTRRHARGRRQSWNMFSVLLPLDRDAITRRRFATRWPSAASRTGVSYEALHCRTLGRRFGCHRGDFPNTERIADCTVTLPLHAGMTVDDVDRVCARARTIAGRARLTGGELKQHERTVEPAACSPSSSPSTTRRPACRRCSRACIRRSTRCTSATK